MTRLYSTYILYLLSTYAQLGCSNQLNNSVFVSIQYVHNLKYCLQWSLRLAL
jgi:hypothetical protein